MNDTWLLTIIGITAFFLGAGAYQITQRRSSRPGGPPALPGPRGAGDKLALRRFTIGDLRLLSGTLLVADPSRITEPLKLDNLPVGSWPVLADVLVGPQGGQRVARITIQFGAGDPATRTLLGEVAGDSGSLALVDQLTYQQSWKPTGPDRIGAIKGPEQKKIAGLIRDRFGLESREISPMRAHLVEPVAPAQEKDILDYLKTFPEYARLPSLVFAVKTNSTADELTDTLAAKPSCELVLDRVSGANIVAFQAGHGDGLYPVFGTYNQGKLAALEIPLIDPEK